MASVREAWRGSPGTEIAASLSIAQTKPATGQ